MLDVETDIDIDFLDPASALRELSYVAGVQTNDKGQREEHLTAVYFQDIPVDPLDGRAVWDYRVAAKHGYFKLDFLKNTTYEGVRDEAHLASLLAQEPPWERFQEPDVVAKLAQIHGHINVLQLIEPQNITELAICLALIRPDKIYLQRRPRFEILRDIWRAESTNGYSFKKSHAIAYAASIVVQLNCLIERALV